MRESLYDYCVRTDNLRLLQQWHPTKNGDLTPKSVTYGGHYKAWWRCEKGHEWQAAIASRASGVGCPICAGKQIIPGENDLASQFPDVTAQWDGEKNAPLTPEHVSPYSNRRVWWRCGLGHQWRAVIASRTKSRSDCPYCSGKKVLAGFNDLATIEPELAAQWHSSLNGTLTPEMVTVCSHQKAWWECPNGHVWKAVVYSRAGPQKCGCPVCAGMVSGKRLKRYEAILAEAKGLSLKDA